MNRKRFILPVLCLLLVISGIFLYTKKRKEDEITYKQMEIMAEKYNNTLKELRKQKENLNKEIEKLKSEIVINGKGSTIILLSDTNKELVENVEKILDEYQNVGVIAIDDYYDPENQINSMYMDKNDINRLTDKGYELVLCVNSNSDITGLYNKYTSKGYQIKGFYYPSSDISNSNLEKIKKTGTKFIITYLDSIKDNDVISIMSIGSYDRNAKKIYEDSVNNSQISALSIGSLRENERFDEKNIRSMINEIKNYEKEEKTLLTTLEGANSRLEDYQKEIDDSINKEILQKIQQLEEELRKIEQK